MSVSCVKKLKEVLTAAVMSDMYRYRAHRRQYVVVQS